MAIILEKTDDGHKIDLTKHGDNASKKIVTFHSRHNECDRTYDRGMKWELGSKLLIIKYLYIWQ
jgi:hypothetical protein